MRLELESLTAAIEAGFYSARTPHIVEGLILLVIAMQVWSLTRTATEGLATAEVVSPASTSAPSRFTSSDLSQLLEAHLFGKSLTETAPATPALAPGAFKLLGLYVPDQIDAAAVADPAVESSSEGNDAGASIEWSRKVFGDTWRSSARPGAIAWLSLSGAPAQRVQVGDAIGGGTVREIAAGGVILELDGRRVRLAFPENPFLAMFRGESNAVLVATDPNAIPPELATAALRFLPELAGEALSGFRVYPGSDEGAFTRTGLRAGDVIEAIDRRPVSVPRDLIPLLAALRDAKPVALRLRRGGAAVDLTLFTAAGTLARTSRDVRLPPGYRPSPTIRPPGAPPPKPRAAPTPPPDLSSPPPAARRSASP